MESEEEAVESKAEAVVRRLPRVADREWRRETEDRRGTLRQTKYYPNPRPHAKETVTTIRDCVAGKTSPKIRDLDFR